MLILGVCDISEMYIINHEITQTNIYTIHSWISVMFNKPSWAYWDNIYFDAQLQNKLYKFIEFVTSQKSL